MGSKSAYNGHFESTCYHPLLLFNREGDCRAAKLRPGNVHSAENWEEVLLPEIEWQHRVAKGSESRFGELWGPVGRNPKQIAPNRGSFWYILVIRIAKKEILAKRRSPLITEHQSNNSER